MAWPTALKSIYGVNGHDRQRGGCAYRFVVRFLQTDEKKPQVLIKLNLRRHIFESALQSSSYWERCAN